MVKWITVLGVLVCLSGSTFSLSKASSNDKDSSFGSWESNEDYYDTEYDHGYGNNAHNLYNQIHLNHRDDPVLGYVNNNYHGLSHEYQDGHDYNYNWGASKHNSQSGSSGKYDEEGESHPYQHHIQTGYSSQARPNNGHPRKPHVNIPQPPRPTSDADRVVFPDFTARPPKRTQTTTRPTIRTTTDGTLLNLVVCLRSCPATSEYNPVCGTNNITYNNPGALQCARNCGINVSVARQAPCPRPVQIPQSTVRPVLIWPAMTEQAIRVNQTTVRPALPIINPTRYTSIDININEATRPDTTRIPVGLLQSVFGSASTTANNKEGEFDIDTRIRA